MNVNSWLLINQTTGATQDGSRLTDADLMVIANVVEIQLNADYGPECGGLNCSVRVGKESDRQPYDKVFYFVDTLPDAPGASAYHVIQAAYCALSTCVDIYGPQGVSVDISHEILEDAGNPGCNAFLDDTQGWEHAAENCDAVETQTYEILHSSGRVVRVSNFVLPNWRIIGAPGPYTFMTLKGIAGGKDPPGPLQTAASPSGQGNYQYVFPANAGAGMQVFGKLEDAVKGQSRKPDKLHHWTSRASRIHERRTRGHRPH